MKVSAVTIILIILAAGCSSAPDYNPLLLEWAKYIKTNPGGEKNGTRKAQTAMLRAAALEKVGYNLYKSKKDSLAVKEYENALKLYATGRLYFRYANSLSNIPRLEDSAKAYTIARALGFKKDGILAYNAACAYSRMGMSNNAFDQLENAVREGYGAFSYMAKDSDLKLLHSLSDWKDKLEKLKSIYKQMYIKPGIIKRIKKTALYGSYEKLVQISQKNRSLRIPRQERLTFFKLLLIKKRKRQAGLFASTFLRKNDSLQELSLKSPIGLCIDTGNKDLAIHLIKMGFSFTNQGFYADSEFNRIATLRDTGILQACIATGINVDTPGNRFGKTPLIAAIVSKNKKAIRLLLKNKADTDAATFHGDTAIIYAINTGDRSIIDIIENHEIAVKGKKRDSAFRRYFKRYYMNRPFANRKKNLAFKFTSGPNYSKYGIGTYSLMRLDMKKWDKEHPGSAPFQFEKGTFRLVGKTIELLNNFSYMNFSRMARVKSGGPSTLYIQGIPYSRQKK